MTADPGANPKQAATAFWKAYFTKFRRHIEDHEVSETAAAPLAGPALPVDASKQDTPPRRKGDSPAPGL